jgi:hypothetical protein
LAEAQAHIFSQNRAIGFAQPDKQENCPDTFKENSSFFIGRFFSER